MWDIDSVFTLKQLKSMYNYLTKDGNCFYIQNKGELIGDIALYNHNEIAITICKEYQNKHIGRRCVTEIVRLAKEKGCGHVRAVIYSFNIQSKKMFKSVGFKQVDDELFVLNI